MDELKDKLERGYDIFETLMGDPFTRRMITGFFAAYMASTADTAWANQGDTAAAITNCLLQVGKVDSYRN